MGNIGERAILILAGNSNSGLSYLITTVLYVQIVVHNPTPPPTKVQDMIVPHTCSTVGCTILFQLTKMPKVIKKLIFTCNKIRTEKNAKDKQKFKIQLSYCSTFKF